MEIVLNQLNAEYEKMVLSNLYHAWICRPEPIIDASQVSLSMYVKSLFHRAGIKEPRETEINYYPYSGIHLLIPDERYGYVNRFSVSINKAKEIVEKLNEAIAKYEQENPLQLTNIEGEAIKK